MIAVTRYRFLNFLGEVIDEREFDDHGAAIEAAIEDEELEDEVNRVEWLGPQGDWRWAGPMHG